MQIEENLISAEIANVFNSLIIDVKLKDGTITPTFCPSSEVAKFAVKGAKVCLSTLTDNSEKIKYQIEFLEQNGTLIYVNQGKIQTLFEEAFNSGKISELSEYSSCRYLNTEDRLHHIDFELSSKDGKKCYVFLETIYNKQNGYAVFPAGINFFEMAMFEELKRIKKQGHRTLIFMIVPRNDCIEAKFSWNLDPRAAAKIYDEAKNGLEFVCYGCKLDKNSVSIAEKMKILY